MLVRIISEKGDGLGLAYHLSSEGHQIGFTLTTSGTIGQGMFSPVNSGTIADIYIYDRPIRGREADSLRLKGNTVLGSSLWGEMIESNPEYAANLISSVGWKQSEVKDGTHLYITTWFNGTRFICTYASMLYRRLMNGGVGPDIGATGMLGNFHQPTETIYTQILRPLEPILRRVNHKGCFHIHLLVNEDKFKVLEISTDFNHPLALLVYENGKGSTSSILLRTLDVTSRSIQPKDHWAAGVLVSIPPFPYESTPKPTKLNGLVWEAVKHLWLTDIAYDGTDFHGGLFNGKIGWVTARGTYINEALKRVYRTVKNLKIDNIQYRFDIGRDVESRIHALEAYDWMK